MVSIRKRRDNRGGSDKCAAYGKFILVGGIVAFLANMLFGGDHLGDASSLMHLQLDPNQDVPPVSRKHPPDLDHERLQRRRKEEDMKLDINHERAKQLEKQEDQDDNPQEKEDQDDTVNDNQEDQHEEENGDGRISGESNDKQSEDSGDADASGSTGLKIQYVSPNGEVLEKPEGTGPTKLGFVMDLVHERSHPTFRKESVAKIDNNRQNHAQAVATALSETDVQPCEYLEETSKTPRLLQHKNCRDPERALVVYNSAPFPRTWCGITIEPNSAARMPDDKHCTEPVHLFESNFPPVDGKGMSPIIVHSHADGSNVDSSKLKEVDQCSIPCQMEQGMTGFGRYIQGTDWTLFQSDQDPTSNREIQVELSKYKHDEYFSTAFFKSDVPLTPFDFSKHNIRGRPAIDFDSALDKALYIVDDLCGSTNSRRTRWVEALEAVYQVDSPGKCKHNKELEAGETLDTLEGRLKVAKKYKFHMGFEISTHKDWVTELSFEAFLSGAVPIILGATNANQHFPRKGAIYTSDFNTWDKFAAHVKAVAENKSLWESYHAWRKDETLLAEFERKYQFSKTSPSCRLCSWAYAKIYGLGWDHKLQIVQETRVPRKVCVEEVSGLIASPFQEIWSVGASTLRPTGTGAKGCSAQTTFIEKEISENDWSITKSVVQHDGVTDITINEIKSDSNSNEITLTFAFKDVNNTEAAFFRNSHTLVKTERGTLVSSATIQDHMSKVTVLANWETNIWSPAQGLLKMIVQAEGAPDVHADEVRRVRLITENIDQLHGKMTEYFPSSFSKRMIKDFVDPLELFYLD